LQKGQGSADGSMKASGIVTLNGVRLLIPILLDLWEREMVSATATPGVYFLRPLVLAQTPRRLSCSPSRVL